MNVVGRHLNTVDAAEKLLDPKLLTMRVKKYQSPEAIPVNVTVNAVLGGY